MTAQAPPIVTEEKRRRRRTILCATVDKLDSALDTLRDLASNLKADLRISDSTAAMCSSADEVKDGVCLIVIAVKVTDAIAGARQCVSFAPNAEIVLLATSAEKADFIKELGPAPRLGNHWQITSPEVPGLDRKLQAAFKRADQRRVTRTTLDRFNTQLSAPSTPVDTGEIRQLVLSDRFLSSLLESAFDAVLLIDRKGVVTAFNPAAELFFGQRKEDVISSPASALCGGAWPDNLSMILANLQNGKAVLCSVEVKGAAKEMEVSATPVLDRTGLQIATSLIIRDVTQRVLAENALRTSEKLAAVGRLASSIAHEINNPLEAVTNLLYLARHSEDPLDTAAYLDSADLELRRVSVIVNQTLRFHRQATAPIPVNTTQMMDTVLSIYQAKLANAHITLEIEHRTEAMLVCMDGEIRQVLNNLVGNAIDAMSSRPNRRLRIRSREAVHPRSGQQGIVFAIADTGIGMDAVTLAKVFEPFFTTKGANGSGLGLWISQEIIARHRGSIRVRSRTDPERGGTTMRLFLPFEGISR